jgi:hypothetical protein
MIDLYSVLSYHTCFGLSIRNFATELGGFFLKNFYFLFVVPFNLMEIPRRLSQKNLSDSHSFLYHW